MSTIDIPRRGTSHHGLSTRHGDETIAFYDGVLGFPLVFLHLAASNGMRHMFFDCGNDEMFTFLEKGPWEGPGPDPIQLAASELHFAFNAGNDSNLERRREQLTAAGVLVSEIGVVSMEYPDGEVVDTCHSIYFRDPVNDYLLEFCVFARDFNERDRVGDMKPIWSANHSSPEFQMAMAGGDNERYRARLAREQARQKVHA